MKAGLLALALAAAASVAHAQGDSLTVFQDPNCGCCAGWVDHMRDSGFDVKAIKTTQMAAIKQKLGVPAELASCHTAVIEGSGQVVEGHVPATAVRKLLAAPTVNGVAAPGMPLNAPGMGQLDGNLITLDFHGRPFSRD
ncbi:DUF411 domain-containing protein [Parapusillimonas sp. JC17]|uniref:DUF411 domain-containing protein n=1 Tax=Parapusillimonas sp. JC17 TaxID=3445768 RepID=UPI003FA12C4C